MDGVAGAVGMPEVAGVGVVHRWVEVGGGVRVHVAEVGEEGARGGTVVLLHGFPQHWYAWRHVMGELAVDHRVVCLDMRGFGWSDAPKRGYDTGTRVADVLAVMDALGVGKARVIAHEFGAWTAFMLCLRAPERVSHLLALNVVHPWPSQRRLLPQAWRYWYTSPLEAPLLGRFVLRHVPGFTRYLLRKGAADPAAIAEFVRAAGERGRARAGEAMHRAYALRDIPGLALGRYRRLRLSTPTRILAGERDFALSPRAVTSADGHADDLTVEVLPGCGHFVHEERPDAVVRAAYALFGTRQGAS
jgi:pimeloyl-ACP methyl ester carboxylesterase